MSLFSSELLDVQHVGSTAVPGMRAKPIVDILAGVGSMAVADALVGPLVNSGYSTSEEFNATLIDRRWFMRWLDGRRTHHLHLVVHGADAWHRHLRFRDVLLTDAELARRYDALKYALAERYPFDREAYTSAKTDFIQEVIGRK